MALTAFSPQGADVEPLFLDHLAGALGLGLNPHQRFQLWPQEQDLIREVLHGLNRCRTAAFLSPMASLRSLGREVGHALRSGIELGEGGEDGLVQAVLVAFDGQNVIRLARHDPFGNVLLAAHRVDGHDAALQVEDLE